jgi:hypothetical protein
MFIVFFQAFPLRQAGLNSRPWSTDVCAERYDPVNTTAVIARLDRAIQYAPAYLLKHDCLWNTGSPAFAGDDRRRHTS